jgi:hypothetical protein
MADRDVPDEGCAVDTDRCAEWTTISVEYAARECQLVASRPEDEPKLLVAVADGSVGNQAAVHVIHA